MITLGQIRNDFYGFSGRVSDISRNLGFAGIALIWLFRSGPEQYAGSFKLPVSLSWPAAIIVTSLVLDLLQYIYQTLVWGRMSDHIENTISPDDSKRYLVSPRLNYVANVLFWTKVWLMVLAYAFLFKFLSKAIIFG